MRHKFTNYCSRDDDLDDHMFLCNAKARIIIINEVTLGEGSLTLVGAWERDNIDIRYIPF